MFELICCNGLMRGPELHACGHPVLMLLEHDLSHDLSLLFDFV